MLAGWQPGTLPFPVLREHVNPLRLGPIIQSEAGLHGSTLCAKKCFDEVPKLDAHCPNATFAVARHYFLLWRRRILSLLILSWTSNTRCLSSDAKCMLPSWTGSPHQAVKQRVTNGRLATSAKRIRCVRDFLPRGCTGSVDLDGSRLDLGRADQHPNRFVQ